MTGFIRKGPKHKRKNFSRNVQGHVAEVCNLKLEERWLLDNL